MRLNYGGIFSFPSNLKFDHINICTNFLIMQQKATNNFLCDINFFEVIALNDEIFCAFEKQSDVINILVTGNNVLHQKSIYLPKK